MPCMKPIRGWKKAPEEERSGATTSNQPPRGPYLLCPPELGSCHPPLPNLRTHTISVHFVSHGIPKRREHALHGLGPPPASLPLPTTTASRTREAGETRFPSVEHLPPGSSTGREMARIGHPTTPPGSGSSGRANSTSLTGPTRRASSAHGLPVRQQ